jgi:ABC-type histidine transport system ATPase subunit
MADRLFVIADHYYSEEDRSGSLSAADRKKRDRFMRQIAMVVQNINDTDREEVALLNHVNELITEKRNAVRQIRATGGPLVRFLGDYDGLMENRVACPDAAPSP